MESFAGACLSGDGSPVRKSRSTVSRRRCSDLRKLLVGHVLLPWNGQASGSGDYGEDCSFGKRALASDGLGSENRPKRLKLKLGGVTHTIHPKSLGDPAFNGGSYSANSLQCIDASQSQEKWPLKDSRFGENNSRGKLSCVSFHVNETANEDPVRKSKRIPKRRVMDIGFEGDADEADEEIHYLGRLNASKVFAYQKDEKGERSCSKKRKSCDGIFENVENFGSSKLDKDGRKKSRSRNVDDDKDDMGEERTSDDNTGYRSKNLGYVDGRNKSTPPIHGWSLKSGGCPMEFPDGLPPVPSKKQKAKLSEVEQQLKRAEAARRRKMLSEKAAKEAEEGVIRKILGQDSGRKKEEKRKKRDEMDQEAANAALEPNTIRWINRPTGTVVIFSNDVGLPNIFNSAACSYPPPREKCAGPNCSNEYKYRDSKSKVPLCSLHCYRAIHQKMGPLISC